MCEEPAYEWADLTWRMAAEAWIHEMSWQAGLRVSGPIGNVRFLPWSAVLRVPTDGGDLYFKACGPSQRHEPALAVFMADAFPECMIPVLAHDPDLGWLLMPDGDSTLTADVASPAAGAEHWRRVLELLAGVQRALLPRAADLLALGVPDRRPAAVAQMYSELLQRPERLLAGRPGALTAADLARLHTTAPAIERLAAELTAIGPPASYIHDDLHEDHVFARQRADGRWRYVFFDYGDACISHPFVQLVSYPRFASGRFLRGHDPVLESLHEEFLEYWRDLATPTALRRVYRYAGAIGCVVRALTWVNACGDYLDIVPTELRDAYAGRLAFWLLQAAKRAETIDDE